MVKVFYKYNCEYSEKMIYFENVDEALEFVSRFVRRHLNATVRIETFLEVV